MAYKRLGTTKCPKCLKDIDIHNSRSVKIRYRTSVVWFFDAINQFLKFDQVRCPNCGNEFKAPEAKLFGVFKSPYTIIALAILFDLLLITYVYVFEFRK